MRPAPQLMPPGPLVSLARLMGPAHVSDRRGWRGAGIGTEGSKAGDSGCSGQGVRKPDGWAALGQFIPENCRVGERERGGHRSRRSTGLFAVHFWRGGIQVFRSAGDRAGSREQKPLTGKGFRAWVILKVNCIWARECLHSGIIS